MSNDLLPGLTVLIAGGRPRAVATLRTELVAAGASRVAHAVDVEAAVLELSRLRPDAVLVLDGSLEALRERLDPLGLGLGPALVPAHDPHHGPTTARRLALALELQRLRDRQADLERVLAAQAIEGRREIEAIERSGMERLAVVADFRDDNTNEHTGRVAHLAALLGRQCGLEPRSVALVHAAGPLHDIGKVAIPDSILLKPERLTAEEYEVAKTHAAVGARILSGGGSDLMETAERIAGSHHERWDGTGYPDGLAGDTIPLPGRLVAVADVFDVLVHERPYKEEWTVADAAEEVRRGAGTQFDPTVVEAFEALGSRAWASSALGPVLEASTSREWS